MSSHRTMTHQGFNVEADIITRPNGYRGISNLHISSPDGEAITAIFLRTLPVRKLLADYTMDVTLLSVDTSLRHGKGKIAPRSHFVEVGKAFAWAQDNGYAPAKVIMAKWDVSKPTADIWIRLGRQLGIISQSPRDQSARSIRP